MGQRKDAIDLILETIYKNQASRSSDNQFLFIKTKSFYREIFIKKHLNLKLDLNGLIWQKKPRK